MKHSLEPNVFCAGHGCDDLITTTAEDAPTVDGMIKEARANGWRVLLNAEPDDDGEVLMFYCPKCNERLSFPPTMVVLEEAKSFIAGFEDDEAQEGVPELDTCEDCENGGCKNCAENMNLPDAITRWNLLYADKGTVGRVEVIG